MALTPAEQAELDELEKKYGAATAPEAAPAPEQALADSLPTTDPGAAWMRKPSKPGPDQGTITMYEPPLKKVQEALAQNPERAGALLPERYSELPLSPDEIGQLTTDHPLYQAYANDLYEQASQQALGKGKKVYRYSQAPWLQGDAAGLGMMQTLGMKLQGSAPAALATGEAFVLGVDNALTLGLAGRAIDANAQRDAASGNVASAAAGLNMMEPAGAFSGALDQLIGPDIAASAAAEPVQNESVGLGGGGREELLAEHPGAAMAGQIAGTLNPYGAAGGIYKGAASLAKPLAGAAPGVLRSAAVSGAAGALGGVAEQGGREVVGAGMNALQSGQAPQMEPGWDDRAKIAAALGGTFGAGSDLLGSLAQGTSRWITGPSGRFGGIPEQFEQSGGRLTTGGPKPSEELEGLVEQARGSGVKPVDAKALELKPHIQDSVKKNVSDVTTRVGEVERKFYPTQEGQMKLPTSNVVETALKNLRTQHAGSHVIGAGKPAANWTRDVFNGELSGVSAQPIKGGIEMSVDEAEAFLGPTWQKELVSQTAPKGAGADEPYTLVGKSLRDLGHDSVQAEKVAAARGSSKRESITLYDDPEKGLRLNDGRSRFTVAKERGDATIPAVVLEPGTGKVLFQGDLPLTAKDAPFAATMRRRGVGKVYVAPRRYTAEEHQQLIETFQKLRETDDPAARDAQKLWLAALKDRDARPMNGVEGGWSKHMQENAASIGKAKGERDLAAPDGNAFNPLVDYSVMRPGQAETANALRDAAVRAGKLGDLEQMRQLGMLDQLQQLSSLGGSGRSSSASVPWMPGRVVNAGLLRSVPTLRKMGDPATSAMRGGRGGLGGSLLNLAPGPRSLTGEMLDLRGTSLDDPNQERERDPDAR